MEKKKQYKEYTDQLRRSTMFHMSLGSKELFHSNFLHWISTVNWDVFLRILHRLTENDEFWWEKEFTPNQHNIEVRREFHHFDLSIYILDSQKIINNNSIDISSTTKDIEYYSRNEEGQVVQKWIPVLILENKMKSLPYRGQLVEYTNKAFNEWRTGSRIKKAMNNLKNQKESYSDWSTSHGITFILLSLMDSRIGKGTQEDYIVSQKLEYKKYLKKEALDFSFIWDHITYRKLSQVLMNEIDPCSFSSKKLDQLVLQDYNLFLDYLCNLAENYWKIDPRMSFRLQTSPWGKEPDNGNMRVNNFKEKIKEIEEYKKLRIHDIHEKLLYDQLLYLLENKIVERGLRCARFDSKVNKERFEDGDIRVFTKSDYAHGVGIFEAQFFLFKSSKLKEGYLKLIIQVQGERYCHMVVCDNVANGAKQVIQDMKNGLGDIVKNVWDYTQLNDFNDTLSKFISISSSAPFFPFETNNPNWGKYGDNIIYQYIDIPHDKTTEDVIVAMVDDIDRIYNWYTR